MASFDEKPNGGALSLEAQFGEKPSTQSNASNPHPKPPPRTPTNPRPTPTSQSPARTSSNSAWAFKPEPRPPAKRPTCTASTPRRTASDSSNGVCPIDYDEDGLPDSRGYRHLSLGRHHQNGQSKAAFDTTGRNPRQNPRTLPTHPRTVLRHRRHHPDHHN